MPPATKRNASVIIYDVHTRPEFQESARKCLLNICASKWFTGSKDNTRLVLLNTQKSDNSIHVKFNKCPHVSETAVHNFDPKAVVSQITDVETAQGDLLMGLAVTVELIKDYYFDVKGIMNIQLLVISDFSTPIDAKEKRLAFVTDNLSNMNVRLFMLGPEVKVPRCMSSFEDVRAWMKEVEFVGSEDDNPNLAVVKQIVQATDGVVCGLELGEHLFKSYFDAWGLQPWKVPLTIGTSWSMPTSSVRFIREAATPKFKQETMDGNEVWSWHLADDVLEEVPYGNVIGGVFKHNKFVALPEDVMKTFKYNRPRSFRLLRFTDRRNVSELYMCGSGSSCVQSDSRDFKLLVHVLAKTNKCAIATKVYMANCRPRLVALLPCAKTGSLTMVELPFANNLKANFVEQDVSAAPEVDSTNPTVDAMYGFLQKLDVTDPRNLDEHGSAKVPLATNLIDSIRLNLLTQRCLPKYLGDNENEDEMDGIQMKMPDFGDFDQYRQFMPVHAEDGTKKKRAPK